jgi:glucose/arabinose dehydrogenase
VSQWVARLDLTTHDAYAFAKLSGAPVDMLVGSDGALYVLTRTGVTRISSP